MAEQKDQVTLSIDGTAYTGWKEVDIARAIDTLCGSFAVVNAARGDAKDPDFQFKAGAAVTVSVDGETVLTGWIDRVDPGFDKESHSIGIAGRDKSADLIDCSAVHKPGSWTNTAIETIASELAKPFGLTVTARTSTGAKLKRFALEQGESVHAAIERMLRYRGLLAFSTPDGNIVIDTPKTGGPDCQLSDQALLSASAAHDVTERFSEYIIKGQASGDDDANGKAVSAVRGEAKDPAVTRHRPLIVIGEEQSTIDALTRRAKWEASTRGGKAQTAKLIVQGWHRSDGVLWAPNTTIGVDEPWLFMSGTMLIVQATFKKGETGTTTELDIAPPEAWSQMAVPESAEAGKVKR